MTSEKKDHLKRGNIEAKRLLDTNNSVRSDTSDKLFSMLEAGESSGIPRDQIDHLLTDILKKDFGITKDVRKDLRILLSTKDKIAHITALAYDDHMTSKTPYLDDNSELLKSKLDKTLKLLECNLMHNEEFTESRILRNSAFNHFSCKLNTSEQTDLNSVWSKLKKLCQDNWYDSLAESTHFTAESNAQKIMNYNEVARQLTAIWVAIDWDTLAKITKLEERVKPLKDLNRKYINLNNNLALTSEIAKKWYKSMIHVSSQKKLRSFLNDLWKKETDFFLPEADNFSDNQFATLEETLRQLKLADRAKYEELLKKYSTTDNQFSEWFLVYFSYKNVEKAKSELDSQKMKTFWHELKDYEQTASKRRWNLRSKIFEIWNRMTWEQSNRHGWKNTVDFASDEDFEVANSYFNKFQNIFYANERDAYWENEKEQHYLSMRNTIAAIIRRRWWDVVKNWRHKRYGSLPRKAAKRLERFAKWQEEKWFWKMVSKTRHKADHAEILAMVIMLQNQASQQMFHGKNTFQKKDSRFWKIFHWMSLAEESRQEFWKTISPYTSKFMRGMETATKGVVWKPLVRWAQRYNKKLLGKSLSLTQEWELSKTKDWTWKYKRRKTPFYAALPVTRILAKWKDWYNNTKKYLWEVKWENINYLYESLNDTVDTITSIWWKTVEAVWTKSYEQYQTNQERSVLDTFFSLASEDEKRKEVIQSCNLAGIFNFNNRETYLFDEDGRVPMLEAPEVNKEVAAGKALSDKIKKQLEDLQNWINDQEDLLSKKMEIANGDDLEKLLNKKADLWNKKWNIWSIKIIIEKLVPFLKDPKWKETEIKNIIGNASKIDSLKKTLKDFLIDTKANKDKIIWPMSINLWVDKSVTPKHNIKADQQRIISDAQREIGDIVSNSKYIDTRTTKNWEENSLNQPWKIAKQNQENRINDAKQRINELNKELTEIFWRESRLEKINTLAKTLIDDKWVSHLDEDTLKSLTNSLDLTLYKPITTKEITQQTNNNLAWTLVS